MTKKLVLLLALAMGVAMIQTSCTDDCDKECGSGILIEEDCFCECDPGYEFDANGSCTVFSADKFLGDYRVNDFECTGDSTDYIVKVTNGSVTNTLDFENFFASSEPGNPAVITGEIQGIDVVFQNELLGADLDVTGGGTLQANGDLIMDYVIIITPDNDTLVDCSNLLFQKL